MRVIDIHGSTGDSTILIGERLENLMQYVPGKTPVIITDTNVGQYYLKDFPSEVAIEIATGEKIKNLDTVQAVYKRLLDLDVDRSSFIVGIGGGIVCDIAGFVASTYL